MSNNQKQKQHLTTLFQVRELFEDLSLVTQDDDPVSADTADRARIGRTDETNKLNVKWLIVNGHVLSSGARSDIKIAHDEKQPNAAAATTAGAKTSLTLDSNESKETDVEFSHIEQTHQQYYAMLTSIVLGEVETSEDDEAIFYVTLRFFILFICS